MATKKQQKPVKGPWVLSQKDQERIEEFTGGSARSLGEALDQWDAERVALSTLFDESQALGIYNKRLTVIIDSAGQLVQLLEAEAPLFMTPKMRQLVELYRATARELEAAAREGKKLARKITKK